MSDDELAAIDEACRRAREAGKVQGSDVLELFKRFDVRLTKAMDAVRSGRVCLHVFKPSERRVWTVEGEHGEYLVLPYAKFCSCNDFYFQIARNLAVHVCYHLIAQRIAQLLGTYRREEHDDGEYISILERAAPLSEQKV